jgi:hypothetical protein
VLVQQPEGIINRCRLVELEDRHYIANNSHLRLP